jgi:hypothetical protein
MNCVKNICFGYLDTAKCNIELDFIGQTASQAAIGLAALPLINIIHESGHVIANHLLFTNSKPKIKLINYGYGGGLCTSDLTLLSKTGKWLGNSNARAISDAAGPIVQMAASLALLRFFPGNGISWISLIANAFYAISALSEKAFYTNKEEDFNRHDFVGVKINRGGLAANTLIISSVAAGIFATHSLIQQARINAYA